MSPLATGLMLLSLILAVTGAAVPAIIGGVIAMGVEAALTIYAIRNQA